MTQENTNTRASVEILEWYDKVSEFLSGECVLPELDPIEFRKAFDLPEQEPLVGGFPVTQAQLAYTKKVSTIENINLDKYNYYIAWDGSPF